MLLQACRSKALKLILAVVSAEHFTYRCQSGHKGDGLSLWFVKTELVHFRKRACGQMAFGKWHTSGLTFTSWYSSFVGFRFWAGTVSGTRNACLILDAGSAHHACVPVFTALLVPCDEMACDLRQACDSLIDCMCVPGSDLESVVGGWG